MTFKGLIVNYVGCTTSIAHLPWIVPEILQMMEAECLELDLNILAKSAEGNHLRDSINKQILLSQQLKNLEDEKEKLKNEMDFINSATIAQVLHNPQNEIQIKSMYRTRLDEIQWELHEKVFTMFYKIPLIYLNVLKKAP